MEFIDPKLHEYCEQHSGTEAEVLKKLDRETHAKVMMPRMLSGHLQGQFLAMISKMCQPKLILEIGTYTGYSAIYLAQGLAEGGRLITIDINEELEQLAKRYWAEAGVSEKIDYRIGNGLELIPDIEGPFDLVFIDADKKNYSNYYDLIIDKMAPGGIILADNVLWSGKVIDESAKDKDTVAIKEYNLKVQEDDRVDNMLLPLRDGIMMARMKK
jgi:caffeoyl-CoA O-methyltransferase